MITLETELIVREQKRRVAELASLQHKDGSFRFRFQGSLMTDAFFIITCRALDMKTEEENIKLLVDSLKASQQKEGYWKAYQDEPNGHLSATIIAYTALLYSGYVNRSDENMKKAKSFIVTNGGISKAHFMIRWMLSVNGLYPWSKMIYVPMTFLLLPSFQPVNFFQFSAYARIHFIPMLLASNKKFTIKSKNKPNLSDLHIRNDEASPAIEYLEDERSPFSFVWKEMKRIGKWPSYLHQLGYYYAEKYILDRLEEDGTLYSYASATFFMIFGLLSLGYRKDSPVIQKAMSGLSALIDKTGTHAHLENSTSTVWDTALISYSLQEAGCLPNDDFISKSVDYLLKKQHTKLGDWHVHNKGTSPGGWGFSDINTNNPDNDDTSAALRALTRSAANNKVIHEAWQRGTNFLLSMQNKDGGWGAFEKNTDWELLQHVPIENAKDAAVDPSTPDLTGRVLEYLGNFAGLTENHPHLKASVQWLLDNQERDGSWYGRWGVCYIYGTWAAITGLRAAGFSEKHASIEKGVKWLKSIQRQDGGWGESCRSSEKRTFIALPFSTDSQTAWAIDALVAAGESKSEAVTRGLKFLLTANKNTLSSTYPTGIGLPGQFYIHYHSYSKIYPLLAISHYLQSLKNTNSV
ncbi:prenyltransferase/squalene oxidase repeat-containing protein [Niallia taxi]|nr:prenyltransferase/squalene oxidase repeat-containing protein [Niallia taxi]MDK8642930.1 prenyltransferase/squalene oxidase repeat-containing protein [Niallia taxi]